MPPATVKMVPAPHVDAAGMPQATGAQTSAPSTPKVSVRNLNFYYGSSQALHNINIDIPERQVMAFIGPSGCGKSTLLRTFNRMFDLYPHQRAEGQILIDGEDILSSKKDVALLRMKVGMVFQKPTPFPISIYDNIAFGVRLYEKLGRNAMDDRVESALRQAALWEDVKDKLRLSGTQLSGGQQQRLCIARALAMNPEIILLDEPTSALDPKSTALIEELISQLKKEVTIILVTHNMQQAARASDYTAFIMLGEVIEYDVTTTMFTNPSQKVTEDYITGRFG